MRQNLLIKPGPLFGGHARRGDAGEGRVLGFTPKYFTAFSRSIRPSGSTRIQGLSIVISGIIVFLPYKIRHYIIRYYMDYNSPVYVVNPKNGVILVDKFL
jgi:hypothetical protein